MAKYQQQAISDWGRIQNEKPARCKARFPVKQQFCSSRTRRHGPIGVKRLWFCILGFNFGLGLLRRHIGRSSHVYTDTTRGAHVCTVCVCVRVHVCMCFCMWHIRVRTYVHIYISDVRKHTFSISFIYTEILVDRYIQAFVRPSLFIRPPSQPTVHPSIHPTIHLSILPSIHRSIDPSIHHSMHACMHTFTQHTTGVCMEAKTRCVCMCAAEAALRTPNSFIQSCLCYHFARCPRVAASPNVTSQSLNCKVAKPQTQYLLRAGQARLFAAWSGTGQLCTIILQATRGWRYLF